MIQDIVKISSRSRFRVALVLAIAADALQIAVFPLFAGGAASPADDILDCSMGAVLTLLLGWHWEFLPSLFGQAHSGS